jgi:Uma2 family endonuclease
MMTNGTATIEPKAKRPSGLRPGVPVRYGTDWDGYLTMTALMGDRHLRTFYGDGEMEILMPSTEHESWIAILGRLIDVLAEELRIPSRCAGMTTFKRDDLEKGLEPDRCYYLTNQARIAGKKRLDMSIDPPPDLALEVEITSSVEKRMRSYAGLGVPEVWRFDGKTLNVNQLATNGEYVVIEHSRYFPTMSMPEFVRFMQMSPELDDTSLGIAFRQWVRQQIAAGWPSNKWNAE